MSEIREREQAVRHLRTEWVASFLGPHRSSPENRRKRAAILEKLRKWRTDK
jgi:hypothetical protein